MTESKTNYGGLILRGTIWHMRFTVKGQQVAESTHTSVRRTAERILAKRKAELVDQVVLAGKRPIKLLDALDKFLKSREHLPSHQNCEIHLRYFRSMPNHFLDRLHDSDIQEVLQQKRIEGYKESTLKVSVSYFNAMLKFLDEQGYTVRKKVKAIKHDSTRFRWLTKDEYQKLLDALDPAQGKDDITVAQKVENHDLIRLLYATGGRYSEVSLMKWSQVDFAKKTIHMKRLKGSNSNTIAMPADALEVLTRRRALEKGDVVFSTKQRKNNEGRWFKAAVQRAGLDSSQGSISVHTIRHTRCCHLIEDGLGLLELKQWIGHRSIQSTMVYAKVAEDHVSSRVAELTFAADLPVVAAPE